MGAITERSHIGCDRALKGTGTIIIQIIKCYKMFSKRFYTKTTPKQLMIYLQFGNDFKLYPAFACIWDNVMAECLRSGFKITEPWHLNNT